MKNITDVIGIDISKLKIDACHYQSAKSKTFPNNSDGFYLLQNWMASLCKGAYGVCFENTGYYSLPLAIFMEQQKILFAMIPPIQIKRSLGLVRGKSDVVDAYQISRYCWLHREELEPSQIPARAVLELSQLLNLREQFVKQKVALLNMQEAFGQIIDIANKEVIKLLKQQVKQLNQQIKKTELAIDTLIKVSGLLVNFQLLLSIKGVGRILAAQLIAHTNNFNSFNSWRQFACYAGIAPFEYQSGSSIKGRTKLHPIADKKLKKLFNMAAIAAIQHDPELKLYYKRKINQGKNKMSTLNAVRCKILARAFSVIKRQTPFVILQAFAA